MTEKKTTPQKFEQVRDEYRKAVQDRNDEIRRLNREEGKTVTELARMFNLDKGLISKILSGER